MFQIWSKSKKSASLGFLVRSLLPLVLMILSFILGYVIGKQRGDNEKLSEKLSLEDLLKEELSSKQDDPQTEREMKVISRLAIEDKNKDQGEATAPPAPVDQPAETPNPKAERVAGGPESRPVAAQPGDRAGQYTLQVGSFQSENAARRLEKELASLGQQATIRKSEIPGKGVWWRVQVGNFVSAEEANRAASGFRAKTGKSCLVAKL